ncbi:MAG TPA: flagellar hook assembly protein FlgD [Telluria sp.]|nr:flagellar hook assembly protein FlgD [Telluria sp.]
MATTVDSTASKVNDDLLAAMNPKKNTTATGEDVGAATDKFMTLLVTQLKNQDPLNPMDNAQLTSQLAQLSTVTGVNKLNDTLESLKSSYQSSAALQATQMIGHGVLVNGNKVELSGSKGVMGVQLASPADKVQVIITDYRTGKDVQTIDLGGQQAGIVPIAWDGVPDPSKKDADGKPVTLKDGTYGFRVVATRGGENLTDATALQFDSVVSVTTSAKDGTKLNLSSLGPRTMDDVKQTF